MKDQNPFDFETDSAGRQNFADPRASGLSRRQVQALLGGEGAAPSRRAFLMAAMATGHEDTIPSPPPPPAVIGKTVLFPLTLQQPYEMPKFSAVVPTPETVGDFEEMGLPAGDGVGLIRDIRPAAQIVTTMMKDARLLFEAELARSGT